MTAATLAAELMSRCPTISRNNLRQHAQRHGIPANDLLLAVREHRRTGRPAGGELLAAQETSRQAAAEHAAWLASEQRREERLASADETLATIHAALVAAGATLDKESESGSRYYTLASGCPCRVADHDATAATDRWLEREDGEQIRIDRRGWRSAVERICGDRI